MSKVVKLQFKSFPSVLKMYPAMMVSKKPSLVKKDKSYKRIEASIQNITAEPNHVNQFAQVCSFSKNSSHLPLPYPHILAAPLHYAVLNHKAFPVKLLGLVHVKNSITQYRPIALQENMDIECFIEGFDEVPNGQVFHMQTHIHIEDELVWEETCSFLARKKAKGKKTKKKKNTENMSQIDSKITSWEVPGNMGRRFAKVSGDVNPIHLSNLTAKMFGFKKAIVHGVWSMSRTMAELETLLSKDDSQKAHKLEVEFKLPVFLPTWVTLQTQDQSNGMSFIMQDSAGVKPHMHGSLSFV